MGRWFANWEKYGSNKRKVMQMHNMNAYKPAPSAANKPSNPPLDNIAHFYRKEVPFRTPDFEKQSFCILQKQSFCILHIHDTSEAILGWMLTRSNTEWRKNKLGKRCAVTTWYSIRTKILEVEQGCAGSIWEETQPRKNVWRNFCLPLQLWLWQEHN